MFTHATLLKAKRAVDFALAAVLAVVSAPLLLAAVALVRLTSAGPAIYSQTRLGMGRRPFTIFKVRTMYFDCERLTGPRWSTENDPRVTPVGHVLRKTHLDELPQLWNVLRGDMSLVGPRPERPEFVARLETVVPRYAERLRVPPGVTGLAQVNLPPDTDHDSVRLKLVYDLDYVDRLGPWLDARILAGTALYIVGVPRDAIAWAFGLRPAAVVAPGRFSAADPAPAREREREREREMVAQTVPAWNES